MSLREWGTGNRTCRYSNNPNWDLILKKYNLMVFSSSCYSPMPQLLHVMTLTPWLNMHDVKYWEKASWNICYHLTSWTQTDPWPQVLSSTAVRCFNQEHHHFQLFQQPRRDKVGPNIKHNPPNLSTPSPACLALVLTLPTWLACGSVPQLTRDISTEGGNWLAGDQAIFSLFPHYWIFPN